MLKDSTKVALLESVAKELKDVAKFGSAGLTLLLGADILKTESSVAFVVIVGWYLALQVLAHAVLAAAEELKKESD